MTPPELASPRDTDWQGAVILSLVQAMPPPIWLILATRVLEGAAHHAIVVAAPISACGIVLTSLASRRAAGDSKATSPQRV